MKVGNYRRRADGQTDIPLLPHWPAWRVIISLHSRLRLAVGIEARTGRGSCCVPRHLLELEDVVEVIASRVWLRGAFCGCLRCLSIQGDSARSTPVYNLNNNATRNICLLLYNPSFVSNPTV